MVLPELPLLTLSFAISALSLSTGLRSASPLVCSVRSPRPLQLHAGCCAAGHGGEEPLQHGAAATIQPQNGIPDSHPESLLALPPATLRGRQARVEHRPDILYRVQMYCCSSCSDGPGSTVQKANAPPCGLPREKEACAGTLEKWRDKYCEHHWPKDLLTAARWTSPGRRTPQIPQIMGFSWDLHWVFMGFSWGFHGVPPGGLIMYEFIFKMNILRGPRVPQGHRPV